METYLELFAVGTRTGTERVQSFADRGRVGWRCMIEIDHWDDALTDFDTRGFERPDRYVRPRTPVIPEKYPGSPTAASERWHTDTPRFSQRRQRVWRHRHGAWLQHPLPDLLSNNDHHNDLLMCVRTTRQSLREEKRTGRGPARRIILPILPHHNKLLRTTSHRACCSGNPCSPCHPHYPTLAMQLRTRGKEE